MCVCVYVWYVYVYYMHIEVQCIHVDQEYKFQLHGHIIQTHVQSNLLLWTLKNKDTSIIRTVGCSPNAI